MRTHVPRHTLTEKSKNCPQSSSCELGSQQEAPVPQLLWRPEPCREGWTGTVQRLLKSKLHSISDQGPSCEVTLPWNLNSPL